MQTTQSQIQNRAPRRPGRPVGSRNTPPKGMLDVRGLAEALGKSPATLRRYACVAPEKLPPRMNLQGLLWSIAVVEAWLAQRTPVLPPMSPSRAVPAPTAVDIAYAFSAASVPAKAPGRGRPRGSRSSK